MSGDYINGGTGEETVTLPNDDQSSDGDVNSDRKSIESTPIQRENTEAFMGTRELH